MIYIYTVCYNTALYIEPQYKLLKKFVKNDFKYIVFNNTMTTSVISEENKRNDAILKDICNKYAITYINIPSELFVGINDADASRRAGTAIDASHYYLFKTYSHDSIFFLIDSDAFLLTPFDIESFMKDKSLSGRIQFRKGLTHTVEYITNHVVIFRPNEVELNHFSFMPCNIDGINCDCGGSIDFIIDKMDKDKFINWTNSLFSDVGNHKQQFGTAPSVSIDFNKPKMDSKLEDYIQRDTSILQKEYPFCEVLVNKNDGTEFLHMRAGTNWIMYDIKERNNVLFQFLKDII